MAPDIYFESMLKERRALEKWGQLPEDDRKSISFRFCEIFLSPGLRARITAYPPFVSSRGRKYDRFEIDLDIGVFAFLQTASGRLALLDFEIDAQFLRHYRTCPHWHH